MTLQEYIDQKEPARMPMVILQPGEYTLGARIKLAGGETLTQLFITKMNYLEWVSHSFMAFAPTRCTQYLIKGKVTQMSGNLITNYVSDQLWTMDDDGNPKARSCFHLSPEEVKDLIKEQENKYLKINKAA